MEVKVLKCNCESEFQDSTYGKGNRLHNSCSDGKSWRCTTCGKERNS